MLSTVECKRLLDIAFAASSGGFPGEARAILDGLERIWPDSPEVRICRAVNHYVVNDFDKAHQCLGDVLAADPGNEFALAHLGVVYHLAGEADEARRTLEAVVRDGENPQAVALAEAMLKDVL
ncbi:tetratricopeptide repeat protein [Desulfocurvus sp.]|jgi:predicted Zn-dependent protease|uniref:tetratricopeptide repeat protein n=1 Tax=Desulfocurvus sp. TaxID=2871698 RepID=UPI0025BB9B55|nr:tetratricopeptide repeat protein [Desulfocurvus sp.]MCK9239991.1 tetratricopeptide repeat protein [Desulfocurvus sp.]